MPLEELLEDPVALPKPRFALTFDDDFFSHVEYVLPVLQRFNVPGTFFLSGRSLHGAGPYWFESLEEMIASAGLERARALLRLPEAGIEAVAAACENDPRLQQLVSQKRAAPNKHLGPHQIRTLAEVGMTIGFHTLHHHLLTRLGDTELREALFLGRAELSQVSGRPLTLFAYPHGKADRRTADKVQEAGYIAAWTGRPGPLSPGDDPYMLNRWEPGPMAVDDFIVSLVTKLSRKRRAG